MQSSAQILDQVDDVETLGEGVRRGVHLVSDNQIIAAGVEALLARARIPFRTESAGMPDGPEAHRWDVVLLWIEGGSGTDGYAPVQLLAESAGRWAHGSQVVALHARALSPVVRLRLAEARVRAAASLAWLAGNEASLAGAGCAGAVAWETTLDAPDHLRRAMSLVPSGRLHPLLRAAGTMPPDVWVRDVPQSRLPVTRAQLTALRRIAGDEAGVPAPEYARYASSVRRAPELPLWTDVRALVRAAWGLV